MISKPDFFIVGAPKSGTTAMNHFLSQHPDIFMAKKEVHYFGSDLNIRQSKLTENDYLGFFSEGKNKKIRGESSVWYLFSSRAAEEIQRFNPDAKIIIMLRNPFETIQAIHKQNIIDGNEDITDFEKAISLIEERKNGRYLPRQLELLACLMYLDCVKYHEQVKRYFKIFGDENAFIIIHDDFKNNNKKTYLETLRFLGINDNFIPEFSVINQEKRIKSQIIQQTIKRPPSIAQSLFRIIVPFKSVRHLLMENILKWNVNKEIGQNISDEMKNKLKKEFESGIKKLSELLNRDLVSLWLK